MQLLYRGEVTLVTLLIQWFLQGVFLTCFCVLGILANTITIIVLSRYNVPSTFTNLLSSLAVIDTLLLVVFLVDSGLERLEVDMEWYTHLIPVVHAIKVSISQQHLKCLYSCVQHMTITGSIYMVVVISIERSRAILSPFQKSLNWVPFLCFVLCLSVFVNLPKFLEFKVRPLQASLRVFTQDRQD